MRSKKADTVHSNADHNVDAPETTIFDDQIAAVNEEIKKLLAKCCKLRTQRNNSQLISRLPPEVLLRIFHILRSQNHDISIFPNRFSGGAWDWITVSRVCRTWRELCLNNSSLWNKFYHIHNADKAAAFIERSKGLDLEVSYVHQFPRGREGLKVSKLIKESLLRVRSLRFRYITEGCEEMETWITGLGPTPRLKKLCVDADRRRWIAELFQNWTPTTQLETLEIHYIGASWNNPVFSGLQVLILLQIEQGPSIAELLTILKNCRGIRELKMINVQPRVTSDVNSYQLQSDVVHLPNLSAFNLRSSVASDHDSYFKLLDRVRLEVDVVANLHFDFSVYPRDTHREELVPRIPGMLCNLISELNVDGELVIVLYGDKASLNLYKDSAVCKGKEAENGTLTFVQSSYISVENLMKSLLRQGCVNSPNLCLRFHLMCDTYELPLKVLKTRTWVGIFEALPHLKWVEFLYGSKYFDEDVLFLDSFVSTFTEAKNESLSYYCMDLEEIVFVKLQQAPIYRYFSEIGGAFEVSCKEREEITQTPVLGMQRDS